MQKAIQDGKITCQGVVQAYLDRVKAYNGSCAALVTPDGKPIASARGRILAGKAVSYPTQTVAASTFLPNLAEYEGPPLEFGRMEATVSDPGVQQQWGMRVGMANAGQLNAIETPNIRGERSVTCKGKFDAPASPSAATHASATGRRSSPIRNSIRMRRAPAR